MTSEKTLIIQLSKLVSKDMIFCKTDISCIMPGGTGGYSLDQNNRINGIKIGEVPNDKIGRVLKIIVRFKYIERLVLYFHGPFELPVEIANLENLKYLDLAGVVKLPTEIFNKEVFERAKNREPSFPLSANREKIESRLALFKANNPFINEFQISVQETSTFSNKAALYFKNNGDVISPALREELTLFCLISERARATILSRQGVYIYDFSKIIDPPYEIITQGIPAIHKYFQEKDKQGTERLYEAKIVIVGAGESGKTTLIKKLINPDHLVPNAEDKRTEGIRVTKYPFEANTKEGKKVIQAYVWDFGGQEIYHTTHQLFLTADTLYILLNDNRKNDTDFYYWLNIVTLRAGASSPILMVFNAKDNAARQIIPGEEIYDTFPNLLKDCIDVNFADNDLSAIKKMKRAIEDNFTLLEVLGKPFPALWVKVRDALVKLSAEHINWNNFEEICQQNGINDLSQMQILSTTLHNLGVLLYFPEIFGLEDLIILNSQWCIDAIYSALDTKIIIDNNGRFNENMLAEKWAGNRFGGNYLQLLKLMQHFDLCYRIGSTNDYIAPQLLPIKENRLSGTTSNWSIIFQFSYIFMPSGLLTRLIARMSLYIKEPHAWRSGVVLEWEDGTVAEIIEYQLTHKILVKINGSERKRRLLDLRKCLYDLQKDFKGLKFEESITCNCDDCTKGGEVTVFKLTELEDDSMHNDSVTCRNGTRKKILAKNILEGISYDDKPRIFISYSHRNEDFKDEFRKMISPMEKEQHWKVWDDRWLLPDDHWNEEIIKHLSEANVIILLITKEFFSSDFIYEIEFTRAIQRHETGDAIVIGILLSDCMWEETPLSKIQILPKDALPIDRHPHQNEVWKSVSNTIKQTINARLENKDRIGGWVG